MKKAFAYYRKSIEREADKSIEGQREEVMKYAAENGIEIIEEFAEVASSATIVRDEFQRMFQALSERSDIDYILEHRFDRATREMDDLGWIFTQLKKILSTKTRLHSVTESNDYDDDHYELFKILIKTLGATEERISAVQRMQDGKRRKAEKGGWLGGTPPIGYKPMIGTGHLAIEESEIRIVKDVFEWREQGETMQEIADRLNEKGYKTRK